MKTFQSRRNLSLALTLGMTVAPPSFAQESAQQAQPQNATQQAPANQDPLARLNLTPEQRQQIRAIREANKDQRNAVNERLKQAQLALENALDSESPSEALVEQRSRELGEAQAAAVRMRSLQEVRIRQVLSAEQQGTLRQLRLEARQQQELKREQQRLLNQVNQKRNQTNQRNTLAPGPAARRNVVPRKRQL